jgi:hypothetical protein
MTPYYRIENLQKNPKRTKKVNKRYNNKVNPLQKQINKILTLKLTKHLMWWYKDKNPSNNHHQGRYSWVKKNLKVEPLRLL